MLPSPRQLVVGCSISILVLCGRGAAPAAGAGIVVDSDEMLRKVFRTPLAPGTIVRIAPGRYRGYHSLTKQVGMRDAPIVVTALDPARPPVFADSPTAGLQVINCGHVTLQHLRFENHRDIGLHVVFEGPRRPDFDTLSASHHITIEDVSILGTGAGDFGNHDGLKIGATDHFLVRRVTIRGWGSGGGSAVDVVGSQYGVIEDSTFEFRNRPWPGTDIGVDLKGGSREIVLRRNLFDNAGREAIEIGQDTGITFFRNPPGTRLADGTVMDYEAKNIEVHGNVIVGGIFPIMWMKSTQSYVHHNTIVMPVASVPGVDAASAADRSILKITTAANAGLARANHGRFERNLIVYAYSGLQRWSNPFVRYRDDGHPSLATFTFAHNAWFQLDVASQGRHVPDTVGRLGLPQTETDPVYQVDPELAGLDYGTGQVVPEQIRLRSSDARLQDIGAAPLPRAASNPAPQRPLKLGYKTT